MAPKSYKLYYFDARGRAEVSRLIFAAAGQKYEDIRLTGEQWGAEKPKTPNGQLPVLEIDGKKYSQSIAIANYLAKEFGFYGKTTEDGLKIDQVVQTAADFLAAASKSYFEKDEAKKAELLKNVKEVEAPKYLAFFEKLLKESGTGHFVGSTLTLADINFYDLAYAFTQRGVWKLDGYPLLQALYKKVESNDKIKAYLAKRKQTDM